MDKDDFDRMNDLLDDLDLAKATISSLRAEDAELRDTLRAIATMDCYTREGEEPVHLLMMRLAREALGDGG